MPVNALSDVHPAAVSVVQKGANGKRFFLKKSDADAAFPLPGAHTLLKADEAWSCAYCVVAEPEAYENPGLDAPSPDIMDVWASADEIRKAAHSFMHSGGMVSKLHESLEPYGQLVENAVALDDFSVNGVTIKKGSWYIGIELDDAGREAIEKGDFTGVSMEGTGIRTLIEKGAVTSSDVPPVPPGYGTAPAKKKKKPKKTNLKKLLAQIAKAAGLNPEDLDLSELPSDLVKEDVDTFDDLMAEDLITEGVYDGLSALRQSLWSILDPDNDGDIDLDGEEAAPDPAGLIGQTCDEFKAYLVGLVQQGSSSDTDEADAAQVAIAKAVTRGSTTLHPHPQEEPEMAAADADRIEKVEQDVKSLTDAVGPLTERLTKMLDEAEAQKPPTLEEVSGQVEDIAKSLKTVTDGLEKLAEGGTAQSTAPDSVAKSDPEGSFASALLD